MQFNVAQLLKEPTGAIRRYDLAEQLGELDPDLRILGPLVGMLTLMRTNSGVLVTGELSTAIQVVCNRCLEQIAVPVRFSVEENFHPTTEVTTGRALRPDEYEGTIDDLEDAALLIDEKHILDLTEIIRQDIWLALPMYPGCNWSGPGECPNLVNRLKELKGIQFFNEGDGSAEVDPRWSALLKLRDETSDNQD